MKRFLRTSRRVIEFDVRPGPRQLPPATDDQATSAFPQPGEVLAEIALILAIHLAVAVAIALTLRGLGIV